MTFLSRPNTRRLCFQLIAFLLVIACLAFFAHNARNNLQQIGQSVDFAFLGSRAGFDIDQSLIPYTHDDSIARVLLVGLLNTLLLSALAGSAATLLGIICGTLRLSKNWLVSALTGIYIDVFRNIPLLLQIFFWYFAVLSVLPMPRASTLTLGCDENQSCLAVLSNRGLSLAAPHWQPLLQQTLLIALAALILSFALHYWNRRRQQKSGNILSLAWLYPLLIITAPLIYYFANIGPDDYELPVLSGFNYRGGITVLPEFAALWLALTLYSAAYIAEYVRAGIQSVAKGQSEAALSLGLPPSRIMRLVILPQALRVIIPPLSNQYLNVVKNSSLAAAIAYPDLVSVFTGTALNQTGRAIEIIAITMAIYLSISLLISLAMNLYNRRSAIKER